MTSSSRRRALSLLFGLLASSAGICSCSKKPAPTASPSGEGSAAPSAASAAAPTVPLKVAFAYVGPVGDAGWTFAHDRARKQVQSEFGAKVVTTFVENVPEGADAERVIRDLVKQGNTLVFGTTFGYMEPMLRVAGDAKAVRFEHATGYKTADNLRTYDSRTYEGAYLAGIVAGFISKTAELGVVGSIPIPEVIRNIDSFTLGAQSINPKVKTRVVWINKWFDPPKEAEAAQALINQGVDVLMQNTDSSAVLQTAEKAGKWAFGWDSDMSKYGPNAHLASAIIDWAPYYRKAIEEALQGTWKSQKTWWGVKQGAIDLVSLSDKVPSAAKAKVEQVKAGLLDGSFVIWKGPLKDQSGKEQLKDGQAADDGFLSGINFYVPGVEGKNSVAMTARLSLHGISKRYPAVVANDDVSLSVEPGEIHAVLGENGAGKSTLMKIVYGVVHPDAGELRWNGKTVNVRSPKEARALGIAMVFQHFSLFDTLTAAENVWLGLDRADTLASVTERVRVLSSEYGLDIDPLRPVHALSVGERQRVEIVRALLTKPELLILDEPTSVLTPQAVQKLFQTLQKLASSGCSILYISHKLDEIRELCQRCTVLRGGRVTAEVDPRRESNASLSRLMIGAEPVRVQHPPALDGGVVLKVSGLSLPRSDRFHVSLEDVELEVHAGEIVGIAGVSGNGQPELMAALSGEDQRAPRSSIALFGKDISKTSPGARRRLGLRFVPEERLGRAAVPALSLAQNTLLTRPQAVGRLGLLKPSRLMGLASELIRKFRIKAGGAGAVAQSLSGGNLQKFIVGRELDAEPRLLVVSQPTWGVDVGAAADIRAELVRLRNAGAAVLVVSEELDELFELSDRLVVMARGRVSPMIATSAATVEQVGIWMSGLWPGAPVDELASA